MPTASTLGDASRFRVEHRQVFQSWLMKGDVSVAPATPTCKLVEQDPNSVIAPHFHAVNQFQVIVRGSGALGKTAIRPFTVHFANAYTPYGPIATQDGLDYFVARDGVDPGAGWMPQERARLPRVPRRHRVAESFAPPSAGELANGSEPSTTALIALEDDGLASWLYRLHPNNRLTAPGPAASGGQFHLVIGGSIIYERREFYRLSCIHVEASEAAVELVAGASGAEVLTMQFPRRSLEDRSNSRAS